jgi:poly-gamma-glutamate synthesis protein (capsule biosynthesis protein)
MVSSQQRSVAAAVTASGAVDLIVGHHAHVLQPIEMVNGRWVAYGLGNFLSNMPTGAFPMPQSQDGAILVATVVEWPDGRVSFDTPQVLPTWVDRNAGWVIRSVLHEVDRPGLDPGLRTALLGSLWRTARLLGPFIGQVQP